mgnify:CR=1 FL=1
MSSMARNPWSKRPTELELGVFEVCWRRYKRGDRDLLDGGVAPRTIAHELDALVSSVSEICTRLRDEGILVELDGAAPTNYSHRRSLAPAALYEGGDCGAE